MSIHDLYESELEDEFEDLNDIEPGSDEHRKAVGDISQLTDRYVRLKEVDIEKQKMDFESEKMKIEHEKINIEHEKINVEKQKMKIEREKMTEERKSRTIQIGKDVMSIVVPAAITGVGMVLMFLFEEKGTITSRAGSKIVDRMFRSN